jgi:hypothetical protein
MPFDSPLDRLLRSAIWDRYRKIPSTAFLAREFNLRSTGSKTVSQESFRRWMLGESMPDYQHLRTLIRWLGLDANQIFVSLEPAKTEKTYMNFSDLLASTQSATAGPGARENNLRSREGNSATYEKIDPHSGP